MKREILFLNVLHILNDGYYASFILLLPFLETFFHLSFTQIGFLGSLPGICAVLFSLPASPLAVKFGGIKILLTAICIYSLAYLLLPLSFSFFMLVLLFLLASSAFGMFHPIAFTLLARLVDPKRRGREIGTFTAIGDTGKIGISAALTFLAASIGWQSTSFLYGSIAFLCFVTAATLHIKHKSLRLKLERPKHLSLATLLSNKRFIFASLAGTLDHISSYPFFIFLPFLLIQKNLPISIIGSLIGAYFLGNLCGKYTMGRLTDRHGHVKIFITAELLTGFCIILLTISQGVIPIIVLSIIIGILTKGTVPVTQTMVTDSIEHHDNFEKSLSYYSLIANIGAAGATILFGFLSSKFGVVNMFLINAAFAFFAIIPAILFSFSKTHDK